MANVIPEEAARFEDPDSFESQVREYVKVKATLDFMDTRREELRKKIFSHLEQEGFEDSDGNLLVEFSSPIDGIARVEKSRRNSRKLDEAAADAIIAEKGLENEAYKTIRVIDEDALMAMVYEDKVTEEELDLMFPVKVTWALNVRKK
jgi:SMC interacting uncharacterized protein involved in chromosome segregation